MLSKDDIINGVKGLGFPFGSYIVFGGAPMTIAGIRDSNDVDILVSKDLYAELLRKGWEQIDKGPNNKPLARGDFEVHNNWDFSSYNPTLDYLLKTANIVEGVPFAAINEVRKWKVASGRPKHTKDIVLIDSYIRNSIGTS